MQASHLKSYVNSKRREKVITGIWTVGAHVKAVTMTREKVA